MKTIAFHSYKGGTGKSYISSNLAAAYSEKEKVCLLDMDLAAPTLHRLFNLPERDVWMNEYLEGDCEVDDLLQKVGNGNLLIGVSNPQPEAIRASLGKSKEREMKSLKNLLSLKKILAEDGFDRLIIDTTPGYEYSSINSVAAADKVGIITILYRPDMLGSREMVTGLYDVLEKPVFMILNRYHSEEKFDEFKSETREVFKGPIYGMKCFCDEAEEIGNKVIALEAPEHPLSEKIGRLSSEVDRDF